MKVGFFGVRDWEKKIIEREMVNLDSFGVGMFEKEVQDAVELAVDCEVISTFIYSDLKKEVLEKLPNLKMIATRSTGVDHIDVGFCKERNIEVLNVGEYGSRTIAEYTWGLILALLKKIPTAREAVDHGEFRPDGLTGKDIFGSTLGVVGVGKIGEEVVKIASGFGVKILAVEVSHDAEKAKRLGYEMVDLDTCLKQSDMLTLHVPSIPATKHLINRQNIKLMKKNAVIINTCRGAVIETAALLAALNNKQIAGAALDVLEEEHLIEQVSVLSNKKMSKEERLEFKTYRQLCDRDDVILTPHNAFNTTQAIERIIVQTIKNINNFMER